MLWPSFRFYELLEQCRAGGASQLRYAQLLSRLRRGRAALTDEDVALLRSRVCGTPEHARAGCCQRGHCQVFRDWVEPRGADGRRLAPTCRPCDDGADALESRPVPHCPIKDGSTVVASLRSKVFTAPPLPPPPPSARASDAPRTSHATSLSPLR